MIESVVSGHGSGLFARFDYVLGGRCQTVFFLFCKPRFTQAARFFPHAIWSRGRSLLLHSHVRKTEIARR